MDTKRFSISEALKTGWKKTTAHFWAFCVFLLANLIVSSLLGGLSRSVNRHAFFSAGVSIFSWLVQAFIELVLVRLTLNVLVKDKIVAKELVPSWPQFWKFFGASILCSIVILIGFICLIVPGIILALRLQFYGYLILEKGLRPVEALRQSWAMSRGQTWRLFLLLLAMIGVVLLGALALGVGLLVAVPLVGVAIAFVYRKLEGSFSEAPLSTEPLPIEAPAASAAAG
jgi:uncharacterized membrane protein